MHCWAICFVVVKSNIASTRFRASTFPLFTFLSIRHQRTNSFRPYSAEASAEAVSEPAMEAAVEAEVEAEAEAEAETEAEAAVEVRATILLMICGGSAVSRER